MVRGSREWARAEAEEGCSGSDAETTRVAVVGVGAGGFLKYLRRGRRGWDGCIQGERICAR
jgi:hypothetical protein